MLRSTILALTVILPIAYVALTWHQFGSIHPCGILKNRMTPYRVQVEREAAMALERQHSQLGQASRFEDPTVRKLIQEDWHRIEAAPQTAARQLDAEIAQLSFTQCVAQAINWNPPKAQP